MEQREYSLWGAAGILHPNCVKIFQILERDPAEIITNKTKLGDFSLSEDQYTELTSELGITVNSETIVYELAQQVYSDEDHKPLANAQVIRGCQSNK